MYVKNGRGLGYGSMGAFSNMGLWASCPMKEKVRSKHLEKFYVAEMLNEIWCSDVSEVAWLC